MTAVFSVTWQSFRLGLHTSPFGLAGLAAQRQTFRSLSQPKQHLRGIHGLPGCSSVSFPQKCNARSTIAFYGPFLQRTGRKRCASLWKNKLEAQTPARTKAFLSQADINGIFGLMLDRNDGNELLKRLQEQRQQGTLDQNLPYPDALIDKGLAYLRAKYPLNEDAATIARIDREIESEFRLPQTNIHLSPHAVSQFDRLRREIAERRVREHAERQAQERAEREEENKKRLAEEKRNPGKRVTVKDGTALVQLRPASEWVQKYRDRAQMKELPEMSAWARLLPSGLVTVAIITFAILFAQNYKQPSHNARIWPDLPPAAATLITLIGINVAVFMLWRLPPFWKFLNRNFLVVPAYPYSMSMLTASFSHQSFTHLLANITALWLIGTRLHDDIGRGPFLALYFSSAVTAAYIPMAVYVMKNFLGTSTLGASGVITALLGASCVLHEGQRITLPFLPPEWTRGIDTGVMLAVFLLREVLSLRKWGITVLNTGRPHIDYMGHLSGYFAGIGAGALIRSTDSRWKNAERKHFFTKGFSKS